jgi:UDP-N-acetylmuramoylalanine--D-glutamate ligase
MTWSLLRAAGVEAVLCGNIAGSGYDEVALTSAAADSKPEQVLVAEISSYQLEWVSQFRPRVAAITNLSPDHGDRHPSIEDYYQTKMRIFAAMSDGDTAVVNGSGQLPTLDQIEAALPAGVGLRVFGPAGSDRGHPTAESTSWTKDEIVLGGRRIDRRQLPLFGEINVINACMAWELAAGFLGGIGDKTAERMIGALADFRGLRHRMEVLGERGGVLVLNNSMCTNPQAVIQSSRALPRRHVLLMGGANKELDYRPVGDYLRETRVRAVLFGQGQAWLLEQLGCDCPIHADLKDAFLAAVEMAKPGEAVMLAPGLRTSFPYKDFMDRGEAFRAIAKEWLES